MTYTKPEVRDIGTAADLIQGVGPDSADTGQELRRSLSQLDIEEE